ncbi:MAG TPA: M23 family metallopeptidase [Thermoanaerobaculia bacterium]|nr:M23 family metallopeptidase [Thermoanaerobaculia bacterium]
MWPVLLVVLLAAEPAQYTFFPMSGIPGKDAFLFHAVDLDPAAGVFRDFECTTYSYDGHQGIDMRLTSFRQQDIGVPIYAVLDGTVVEAHDGEPDRVLEPDNFSRGNWVMLDHGGTHYTLYFHMRTGSVAVAVGQRVSAGTQLGLVASSGRSNWPHLHFQSEYGGRFYEPNAGPCREGPSYWGVHVPIERAFYAAEFGFSPLPYEDSATYEGVAEDTEPRTGTYAHGSAVHFRIALHNVPVQTSYEMRLRRPDGTIANTRSNSYNNTTLLRSLHTWGSFNLEPNVLGTWSVEVAFNGATMITAPFLVVATSTEIHNRAPNAVTVSIKPGTVPRCEVDTSLVHEDPDYDVMRYRYQWTVGNRIVREVTSAGLMDALPSDAARLGDRIACTVTPNDGVLDGPVASAELVVSSPERRRSARH